MSSQLSVAVRVSRRRTYRRALLVATHAANTLALPLVGPVFSLAVVRFASLELWGQFVGALIAAQLAAHLAGWGNKDYLLREFSREPARLWAVWQTNLRTRLVLLAPLPLVLAALGWPVAHVAGVTLCGLALLLDQAYDVLVLYRKDFVYALGVEAVGLALLAVPVVAFGARLTLAGLLGLYALSNLAKAGAFALRHRPKGRPQTADRRPRMGDGGRGTEDGGKILGHELHEGSVIRNVNGGPPPAAGGRWPVVGGLAPVVGGHSSAIGGQWFAFGELRRAWPFFLLGFSGLLQSRVDLYAANAYLPDAAVAQYQVFTNLMLYGQAMAGVLLMPFVKGLYRLPARSMGRVSGRLGLAGLAVVAAAVPAAHLALTYLYRFDLPSVMLALGALFMWPIFAYLPIIYGLFKAGRPGAVIAVNGLGIAIPGLVNVALLPRLGLVGAALSAAAAQWAMLAVYAAVGWQSGRRDDA